jgi:ATP-dependent Lon protease
MYKARENKKDAGDGGDKASGRKQPVKARNVKKSGTGPRDDDDSVDSHGNLRGLITYDSEEDSEATTSDSYESESEVDSDESHLTPEQKTEIRRSARKAAVKARERIQQRAKEDEKEKKNRRRHKLASAAPPKKKKKVVEEEEEDDEEEDEEGEVDEEEDDDDEEEDDEDEDEDDEDDNEYSGAPGFSISIGGFGGEDDFAQRMKPKRHNMKKESDAVKKFVKLVSTPQEENTIDDQIDQFKSMTEDKQKQLLEALDRKTTVDASQNLMFKILTMNLPPENQSMVLSKYNSLQSLDPSSGEYFKLRAWLEKLTSLPLGSYKEMPVKLSDGQDTCGVFMNRANKCLHDAIYGQEEAKLQILQFIANKISNPSARGLSLLLTGPPGIGKTSLIRNGIAKALDWPFQFISLGGDSDASTYTGHQMVYEGSHCGKIVNSLVAAKSMSTILMFDEVDKISTTPKGEEVMNLLIHLTDPVQNGDFEDKYLAGVPIDLSHVMFAFSGNDLNKVDRVLLDRMVVVHLQGYNAKEKLAIAENFLVPGALRDVNLEEKISISKEVLQHIIEEFASEESGVRELKRCIEQVAQKVNMLRMFNTKDLPFHIPDFHLPFIVKKEHISLFLKKKKGDMDVSVQRMYS